MAIQFPADPGAQTPVNEFSPTSTPIANTENDLVFTWNGSVWNSSGSGGGGGGDQFWERDGDTLSPANDGDGVTADSIELGATDDNNSPAIIQNDSDVNGTVYARNMDDSGPVFQAFGPDSNTDQVASINSDGSINAAGDLFNVYSNGSVDLYRETITDPTNGILTIHSDVGGTREQKAIITADGSIEAAGSVSIGGTDADHAIQEYERGNFDPVFESGVTGGSLNMQTGRYVRIGDFCHFQLSLRSTGTSNSGHLQISGLPFTSLDAQVLGGAFWVWTPGLWNNGTSTPFWQIFRDSRTMGLYAVSGDPWQGSTENGISGNAIYLCGSYRIAP